METIQSLRENYIKLRARKDELAELEKQNNAELASAERKLIDAMSDADITSIKLQCGASFTITPRLRFSVTLTNTDQIVDWLESKGHNPDDILREELIPTRVREIVRDLYHKEGKAKMPDFLKLDDTPGITVTDWAAAKAAPSSPED